ncbi:MAG: TetR/AcrR family transcriptional regulator [Actinobacteria bacterium]|nr:MAG: TetR/AcrR family transcriptional regulator [Actinomycetota bacterium]
MIRDVTTETRPLRADAERNRKRLLDAAAEVFAEHGLEASTAEIARRAGVGQGTVFRRFPTKDDLVAAIVVDRLHEFTDTARGLLAHPPAEGAVLAFMAELASMHVRDRGLIEAVNGTRALADAAVHDAHGALMDILEELVKTDREAGLVREDLGAFDVMALSKAVASACEPGIATAGWKRYLAVVAAGLQPSDEKLPGKAPTRAQLDRLLAELSAESPSSSEA